jgi:hypothetical protein
MFHTILLAWIVKNFKRKILALLLGPPHTLLREANLPGSWQLPATLL